MKGTRRAAVLVLVVLVVLAATLLIHRPSTSDLSLSAPPTSAELQVAFTSQSGLQASGTIEVNFVRQTLSATLTVPVAVVSVQVTARVVGNQLFVSTPNLRNKHGLIWYVEKGAARLALSHWARELRHPNPRELAGTTLQTQTTHGAELVSTYLSSSLPVRTVGTKTNVSGHATWKVTTGSEGQLLSAIVNLATGSENSTISTTVLRYDQPVQVGAPPKDQQSAVSRSLINSLLATHALQSVLLPGALLGIEGAHS